MFDVAGCTPICQQRIDLRVPFGYVLSEVRAVASKTRFVTYALKRFGVAGFTLEFQFRMGGM
jgi:hypothetical protein